VEHLTHVIGGPRACLRVDSIEEYRRWARRVRLAMHLPAALTVSQTPLVAHVSDGRWCADCPCGAAALCEPDWGMGICPDCGTEYPITFPADREAVEAVLLARPSPRLRHFFPHEETATRRGLPAGETVASLRRENRANGHPITRGGDGH